MLEILFVSHALQNIPIDWNYEVMCDQEINKDEINADINNCVLTETEYILIIETQFHNMWKIVIKTCDPRGWNDTTISEESMLQKSQRAAM